jgi:hypothetical protein
MERFFDALDISSNIQRGLAAIQSIRGIPAAVMLVCLAVMNWFAIWPLVWYFDIDATREFSQTWAQTIIPTLPGYYAANIAWVVVAISLFPTFCEMFASRFARYGFILAGWLVFASASFDLVTDWPRAEQFTAPHTDIFAPLGFLSAPAFWLYRAVWLVMGSFGFEAWLAVTTILCFALLLNVFIGQRRARGEVA